MATTQNTYTGDGSTTNYSFTFEYIKQADVKVTLDDVATTAFTFANATTLSMNTAPTSGAAIRIYRDTDIDVLNATFFPGSAIKAEDLNNNFTQTHFATQETDNEVLTANTNASTAKTTADTALTNSAAAVTTANSTVATANTANTNASAAVTTANAASATATTAATDAASAVTTANTASTNASNAVTTANAADANATTALTNSRESDGSGGFTTAIDKANTALTTANSANTSATSAVTTANSANTSATNALNTANAASAAVSNAVLFTLVANVAAIPGSPSNNDYVEMGDSTGIESFSPLSNLPSGFVGASGLTVRIRYDSSATSWVFMSYFANDSEARYLTKNVPVVTGDATNGSGQLTLNCENNSHGVKIKGPPHSAAATYTLTLPNNTGTNGQALKTDGSGTLSFADVSSSFITQTDFAYKPTSNSLTLNVPNYHSTDPFGYTSYTNSGSTHVFHYSTLNSYVYFALQGLSSGDAVTIDWTLTNGTVVQQTTSVSTHTYATYGNVGILNWNNANAYDSSNTTSVKLTSSTIVNGVDPLANNQILKYKTATGKWTVSDPEAVVVIIDAGNFNSGGSLVSTSTTYDGGSF